MRLTYSLRMSDSAPELLKLSEVRARNGVPVDTLKMLISDRLMPGVERGRSGHVTIRADMVPTYGDVVELVEQQLRRQLEAAAQQVDRVDKEVEAVRNDIALALEDLGADLGHDLMTLKTYSNSPQTSLASALGRLEERSWGIRQYHRALRELVSIIPPEKRE